MNKPLQSTCCEECRKTSPHLNKDLSPCGCRGTICHDANCHCHTPQEGQSDEELASKIYKLYLCGWFKDEQSAEIYQREIIQMVDTIQKDERTKVEERWRKNITDEGESCGMKIEEARADERTKLLSGGSEELIQEYNEYNADKGGPIYPNRNEAWLRKALAKQDALTETRVKEEERKRASKLITKWFSDLPLKMNQLIANNVSELLHTLFNK